MPPALQAHADSVTVCVEFENLPCQSEERSAVYTYEKNPTVSFIHPKKSYLRWAPSSRVASVELQDAAPRLSLCCDVILVCSIVSLLCSK